MSEINFCPKCGQKRVNEGDYCVHCGSRMKSDSEPQTLLTVHPENPESSRQLSWIGFGLGVIIGIPAIQSAFGMPSQAEYVTFDFTFNHFLNGGWYTWYSGDSAIMAKFVKGGGMSASNLRLILWFVSGLSLSLAAPALKLWLHRFIKDVNK